MLSVAGGRAWLSFGRTGTCAELKKGDRTATAKRRPLESLRLDLVAKGTF